ncbi:hypothetical protein D9619_003702 [Psilocybe cf. subviscida]|uniref:Tat pathway signal sequence n=1 Tax=Psilocybe cf. subviscida TaxID=2480587 RepID=A0A8H5AYA3_9AGAR|nr:hypothetical protein D9619_003702 [Psilocybe cf. subviscida]
MAATSSGSSYAPMRPNTHLHYATEVLTSNAATPPPPSLPPLSQAQHLIITHMAPFDEKTTPYADRDDVSVEDGVDYDSFKNGNPIYVPQRTSRRTRLQLLVLWAVLLSQALVIVLLVGRVRSFKSVHPPNLLYSPVQHLVSYHVKTFNFGIGDDLSSFQQPPSDHLDQMWEDLYDFGVHKLTKEEASILPNKTSAIPGDVDGSYISEIEVFHQLHCLNMIRQALYPEHYPDMALGQPKADEHIGHCIDSIRQSLMCHADTSTIVWQWDEKQQKTTFRGNVAHTCRDFEAIQDWARERRYTDGPYRPEIRMEDDIQIPIYNSDGTSYFP